MRAEDIMKADDLEQVIMLLLWMSLNVPRLAGRKGQVHQSYVSRCGAGDSIYVLTGYLTICF